MPLPEEQTAGINEMNFSGDGSIYLPREPKGRLRQPPDTKEGGWCYGYTR